MSVEGVGLPGVDVQRAADLVLLVDGQREPQRAEAAALDRAWQVAQPPGVGDRGELTGTGGVQAESVDAIELARVEVRAS
ncbi:hypothetical protein JOD57_000319 [Geodermatophilus bullaregiensis]|uniref:hypothetical protein n=1 Tax=Geodermatophilus bullaregiensis TaxID=1564160 RepID=UPI0027DAD25E|nr:hypothetical protein [Geodermatophilus bullaregiensis]MBM7804482.1 hypothetical protein [Geodermatophilus bullaregiensis]